jgi:uncharacterized damage-inducible protein DinB
METLDQLFLDFSARKIDELSKRIDTCLERLSEEQIWLRGKESENAAGNLVLHLCGNVRQWIVANIGGQPDRRDRDSEFSARSGVSKLELRERLRVTVDEALQVIGSLPAERLSERVTIQGYEGSVLEAIYHVVEHFSMHAGQLFFMTKMLTTDDLGFYRHLQSGATAHGQRTP